jgi:hypothetical protein
MSAQEIDPRILWKRRHDSDRFLAFLWESNSNKIKRRATLSHDWQQQARGFAANHLEYILF